MNIFHTLFPKLSLIAGLLFFMSNFLFYRNFLEFPLLK
nr:MAG TPA: hypothetical protein [Caudoviricetes sp.]